MMGAFLNGTLALWAPEIRKWIKPVYSKWFHNVIGIIAFAIGMASIRFAATSISTRYKNVNSLSVTVMAMI